MNSFMNARTVELPAIRPGDNILEVGFGGCDAIAQMAHFVRQGLVVGIDISDSMLERGQRQLRKAISEGRVQLKKADASHIPYETGFFDKACAVNVVYFWPDPSACLTEIRRVLRIGGHIVLGVRPKESLETFRPAHHGFAIYSDEELQSFLREAGYLDIQIEHCEPRKKSTLITAMKK